MQHNETEKMPWDIDEAKVESIVKTETFPAELCFSGAITPQGVVDGLLENYSAIQAYVICKKWSELFGGTTKFTGAMDLLKADAINSTNQKMMGVEIGGHIVAYANEKNLPAEWEYEDSTLTTLEEELVIAKKRVDDRKKMLQGLKSEVADTATGEVMKPAEKLSAGVTVSIEYV